MHSETYKAHERWMRSAGLSENTVRTRRAALRSLIGQQKGRPLADLTEDDLNDWAEWLAGRLSRSSRHVYVSNVRSYYAWAFEQGRYDSDPARRLPVPSLPKRVPHPIPEESLAYALGLAPLRVKCWLALAALAGLRACEIAGLRGENVILTGAEPYLHIVADATKGVTERIVPISAELAALIGPWFSLLPARGPCFHKLREPDEPVSPNLVSKIVNEHLRSCGITSFRLHSGRHRFLTEAHRATGNILTTQKLAGHASPATTAGYAQVTDTDTRAAVNAIPPLDAA